MFLMALGKVDDVIRELCQPLTVLRVAGGNGYDQLLLLSSSPISCGNSDSS